MPSASHIVVVHQQDGTDVRIGKVCRTVSRRHRVTYLGWNREMVETSPDLGASSRLLFARRGRYGSGSVSLRLAFMWWLAGQLLACVLPPLWQSTRSLGCRCYCCDRSLAIASSSTSTIRWPTEW